MWDKVENRLALLELIVTGRLRRRKRQEEAWLWLAELSWTRQSRRQHEIVLVEERGSEARRLLDQAWSDWELVHAELEGAGLPPTEQGWRKLLDIDQARAARGLPTRLNRRTALAQVATHSKANLSAWRRQTLEEVELMHDGTIRLRPPGGLRIRSGDHEIDGSLVAQLLGEVIVSERAFADGTRFCGTPPLAVLLVENLGAYLDLSAPAQWLVAHAPGWDTHTVQLLLSQFASVPIVHFGDLDPNGVRIMRHLRAIRHDLLWFVPDFWEEYVETKPLSAIWPADLALDGTPALVRKLMEAAIWLEQEAIILDPRLSGALHDCLARGHAKAHSRIRASGATDSSYSR